MDKSKLTMKKLEEFAKGYMTFADSCKDGREFIEEWRFKNVTSDSEILCELPSDLAEEFSNALIDVAKRKKIREDHKDTSPSDKEEHT